MKFKLTNRRLVWHVANYAGGGLLFWALGFTAVPGILAVGVGHFAAWLLDRVLVSKGVKR